MKNAIFYIADNIKYGDEATVSAESFRRHKIEPADIFLFSPLDITWGVGETVKLPERETDLFFYDHTRWMNYAFTYLKDLNYTNAIYMDCDTFVCENFDEVFELLEHFTMLGVHAPARQTTRSALGLTTAFPEINLGFNPMRLDFVTENFMDDFVKNYTAHIQLYGNNDQGAFRDTLYEYITDIKYDYTTGFLFHTLPTEYNCRFNFPCAVAKKVKILHGHSNHIARVAKRVNSEEGMRSWISGEMSD